MDDQQFVEKVLENNSLKNFIYSSLRQSLGDIGFPANLLDDLLNNLTNLDVGSFCKRYGTELNKLFTIGFFQDIVPRYFSKYIVPAIKSVDKVVDVGCGTGILAKLLSESGRFNRIIGIDINPYLEWDIFKNDKVSLMVIKEKDFTNFLLKEQPDSVTMTWVLHHMEFEEQERYLKYLYTALKPEAQVVILEDTYSESLRPLEGAKRHDNFIKWPSKNRFEIMAVQDWLANRVLARREKIPIPFGYRTLEDWVDLLRKIGFKVEFAKYLGFPKERDINNPQGLIVAYR
jgi:2-polyprenyl-3-methyl-5-hydroxy-6-metoxy-1,4-benzoquinol methylase